MREKMARKDSVAQLLHYSDITQEDVQLDSDVSELPDGSPAAVVKLYLAHI